MSEHSDWQVESIFHFVVNASDLEKSLAFYQTLGFRILSDRRNAIWPDFVADNFGVAKAQGRGCLLGLGDAGPGETRLDLLEWIAPQAHDDTGGLPVEQRIPRIIALRTRNVAAAVVALKAKGIEFINTPMGPNPDIGIKGIACCRDPDGLVVELIEYMPGVLGSITENLDTRND